MAADADSLTSPFRQIIRSLRRRENMSSVGEVSVSKCSIVFVSSCVKRSSRVGLDAYPYMYANRLPTVPISFFSLSSRDRPYGSSRTTVSVTYGVGVQPVGCACAVLLLGPETTGYARDGMRNVRALRIAGALRILCRSNVRWNRVDIASYVWFVR